MAHQGGFGDWQYPKDGTREGVRPTAQPQWQGQPGYAPQPPVPGPPQPVPSGSRKFVAGAAFFAGAAVVAFFAGWVGMALESGGSTPRAPAAATAKTVTPQECAAQLEDWASTGEGGQLGAFAGAIDKFGSALTALAGQLQGPGATASGESAVQSAAATMQGDAQALQASPGPACVPGLADNLYAAARDYSAAAGGASDSITEMQAGDGQAAASDLGSAAKAETRGNAKIAAANKALRSFEAAGKA